MGRTDDARAISEAAVQAVEREAGEKQFAVVVVVHQLGTDFSGLAINVATNIKGATAAKGIARVLEEGLRVVKAQGQGRLL